MGWSHSGCWPLPNHRACRRYQYPSHRDPHRLTRHHRHHRFHSSYRRHCRGPRNQQVHRSHCRCCRCRCHPWDLHQCHRSLGPALLASLSLHPNHERGRFHSTKHRCREDWECWPDPNWRVRGRCTPVGWSSHHHQGHLRHHHFLDWKHQEDPIHTDTPNHLAGRHCRYPNLLAAC